MTLLLTTWKNKMLLSYAMVILALIESRVCNFSVATILAASLPLCDFVKLNLISFCQVLKPLAPTRYV